MTEPQHPHPPPAIAAPRPVGANRRPGSVTAAAWITIALSVTGTVGTLVLVALAERLAAYLRDNAADFDLRPSELPTDAELRAFLIATAVVVALAGLGAVAVAVATLKRQPWARITLVILAALCGAAAIPLAFALVGIPWLAGGITVIALLFTGSANRWFAATGRQRVP